MAGRTTSTTSTTSTTISTLLLSVLSLLLLLYTRQCTAYEHKCQKVHNTRCNKFEFEGASYNQSAGVFATATRPDLDKASKRKKESGARMTNVLDKH